MECLGEKGHHMFLEEDGPADPTEVGETADEETDVERDTRAISGQSIPDSPISIQDDGESDDDDDENYDDESEFEGFS